jgi:hypothetical protein
LASRIENINSGQLASPEDRHSNADVGEIRRNFWRMQLEFKRILIEARYDTYWMRIQAAGETKIVYVFQTSVSEAIEEILGKTADVRTGGDMIHLYSILGLNITLQHKVDLYY